MILIIKTDEKEKKIIISSFFLYITQACIYQQKKDKSKEHSILNLILS